ncbi:Actin 3 [Hibiscus syriacus]|uniref:Dol-P-Glc:Glc(2)Man(9)GlcNAc(2)-PP-Dol alpha-1,2-glucosyltransferase n=1 Tax=Hibiscus syriacus TaxID=106335 RepID=A0A6A2ZFQ4_HIBSY|nr:dol-P-Glc:Glc(2)Man(9)GlcNAc(2)-PP-Dol alpha-1,2-glucosyltransferase [Hibiscus syriacus]XP_039016350.1 dol-P-Glc:Glc(2)Man(9)GlcNAc(2)-PP-Dol alpha-1,2-glucosyltransferase [Hibiscus syriacus]KAE8689775.1 Actin 3 [Hibiscus syriacus]
MGRKVTAAIVSLWVIPVSILVNRIVPDPYMDEIFHIPQAQKYCNGDFMSWDPMITTPPGLYYLSLVHVSALFPIKYFLLLASSFPEVCSTVVLRSVNGVLAVLCSILVYEIIIHLRPGLDDRKATLFATVLTLYPLHWFFTFLYYTDVASLTAVLAMYLACMKKKYLFSALLGATAVVIRQTNIVWMFFVACSEVIDITMAHQNDSVEVDDLKASNKGTILSTLDTGVRVSSNLRRRKSKGNAKASKHSPFQKNACSTSRTSGLLQEIQAIVLTSWRIKWELLVSFSPFFFVLLAFVAFLVWNGSVVLGAKEAHVVSPHFAQIMYFSLVSAILAAPLHFTISHALDLFQSFWKNRILGISILLLALIASFLSVHFFSIAHPYLLADNRHYTFYLWRKIMKFHWSMKYLLVPFYVYSWFSIFRLLDKTRRRIWILVYFVATSSVLIPAPLIEFRYYTIPFYFLILHTNINDSRSWLLIGILYTILDAFTMTMFLFRPFQWYHEQGVQRFIW